MISLQSLVAPHQFGQMTYDRAPQFVPVVGPRRAIVSHGLTSSPPRGEGPHTTLQLGVPC
jgi:hypothetical protein